jgi:hypothetical protein
MESLRANEASATTQVDALTLELNETHVALESIQRTRDRIDNLNNMKVWTGRRLSVRLHWRPMVGWNRVIHRDHKYGWALNLGFLTVRCFRYLLIPGPIHNGYDWS